MAPKASDARMFVAQAYLSIRQNDRAREHLDVLLRESPSFAPAWYLLTSIHLLQGQRDEALSAYRKLQTLNANLARQLRERTSAQRAASGIDLPE